MPTGDPCACGRGMLGECPHCNPWKGSAVHIRGFGESVVTPDARDERIRTLIEERDKAREECGHEKHMRKSASDELTYWIKKWNEHQKVCTHDAESPEAGGH